MKQMPKKTNVNVVVWKVLLSSEHSKTTSMNHLHAPQISQLKSIIHTLPLSTADCERGFSTMNVIATTTRNSQNNQQSDVLYLVGPPQVKFEPAKYLLLLSYIMVSSHIVNSVCWSHALVKGPTSKRPASDGGRCSGQILMMWSAVCSGSPHSHAPLPASPHFVMDALYRPTPVRSLFRVVQCFRLRSSPSTPSPGSDTWQCTRVDPDVSHSYFHVATIHASFDRSSAMTLSIS